MSNSKSLLTSSKETSAQVHVKDLGYIHSSIIDLGMPDLSHDLDYNCIRLSTHILYLDHIVRFHYSIGCSQGAGHSADFGHS